MNSRRGNSLIQVMIASIIVGVILYSVMTMIQNLTAAQMSMQQKIDSLMAQSLITAHIINDLDNCNLSVQGKPFVAGAPIPNIALNELVLGPATAPSAIVKTAASTVSSGLLVQSIELQDIVPEIIPNEYRSNVTVRSINRGLQLKDLKFPLYFELDSTGTQILRCSLKTAPPQIIELALGTSQAYPAGSCPGGWIVAPALAGRRLDCSTSDTWVGVAVPAIDGVTRYEYATEFGSAKSGGSGHGWTYMVRGLSQRHYLDNTELDPTVSHNISLEYYIGNRGGIPGGAGAAPTTAAAFSTLTAATSATPHPCIQLFSTTLMIECLR